MSAYDLALLGVALAGLGFVVGGRAFDATAGTRRAAPMDFRDVEGGRAFGATTGTRRAAPVDFRGVPSTGVALLAALAVHCSRCLFAAWIESA
jgi:hypothetical protein